MGDLAMAESMTGTSGAMSPLQARIFARVPAHWSPIPPIGVHEAILRALKDRGVIETQWENGIRRWRRTADSQQQANGLDEAQMKARGIGVNR